MKKLESHESHQMPPNLVKSALTLLLTSLLAMPTCLADDDQSALLGQWTFNTGSTSAARLQSSNPAAGVTLSSLAINSKVTDFGPGTVPSGDDDGMGFGGNNGASVMFWHRANYTNTNAPSGKATTWGVPGVDVGIDTTVANAPMSFTVNAGPGQTIVVESLWIINSSGSGGCRAHFQEAGQAAGGANSGDSNALVPLNAPVVISPGSTKTFTVNWSGDALNIAQNIDRIDLRGAIRISGAPRTVRTKYSSAAGTATPPSGWAFYWNAPSNWVAGVEPGDLSSGAIHDTASWRPMVWAGSMWTADGNTNGSDSSPDDFIRLNGSGGHPGGVGSSRDLDRYAISVFTVDTAGDYQLGLGWIEKGSSNGNGLLVKIFCNGQLVKTIECAPGSVEHVDARFENMAVGDEIAVAVGADGEMGFDSYAMDYEIVLCDPTFDGLPVFDVANYGAAGDGTTDDFHAIQAAVNAAKAARGGIVRFDGTKTYRAIGMNTPDTLVETLFDLRGAFNIKIEGNGASLLLHPPDELCVIDYSENIQIDGFTVAYDPAPYYQGTIDSINVGNLTMDITVPDRYDVPETGTNTGPTYFQFFGRGFIPNTPGARWGESYHLYIDSTETIGGNPRKIRLKFRSDMTSNLQNSLAATEMVVPHIRYGQRYSASISIISSSRVKLSNILYHHSSYILCVAGRNTGPVTLSNFDVLTTDPATELFVSWRDLFHLKDNAYGVLLEDGDWDGGATYDDTFNFSHMMKFVVSTAGNQLHLIAANGFGGNGIWRAGDLISIWDPTQNILRGRARIVAPGSTTTYDATLTLDRAITASANDWVVNDNQINRGMLVRNCRTQRLGASAATMRLSTPTTFQDVHLDGCYLRFYWTYEHEGPKPRDMRIENMYIRGGGFPFTRDRPVVVLDGEDILFKNCTIDAGELYSHARSKFAIDHVAWINNTGNALNLIDNTIAHVFNNSTRNGAPLVPAHASLSTGAQVIFDVPPGYPLPAGYDTWAQGYNLPGATAAATYDADSDGLNNLLEYALGGNPTLSDSATVLPTFGSSQDGAWFYHVHKERTDDDSLVYTVQTSTDLTGSSWTTNGIEKVSESAVVNHFKTVTTRTAVGDRAFTRLKIERK